MSDEAEPAEAYTILGLKYGASEFEIKKAWRALSKELHPDANGGDPKKAEQFKVVEKAYNLLDGLRKENRLPANPDYGEQTRQSPTAASVSNGKITARPASVSFEAFEGIVQVHPPSVTVRIEQAGEVKRPKIQKAAGDFWRATLVEPSSEDHRYGVLFTCTVAASTPVDHYTDTTKLVVGNDLVVIPIELTVLPLAYMSKRGSRSRLQNDEAETEEQDDEEEYSNERYLWLTVCIVSLVGPFGLAAIALPRDGVYNFGTGLIGLLCAAWFFVGLPLSAGRARKEFREYDEGSA